MNSCFLCRLSKFILVPILLDWIELNAIGNLNVAVSHIDRKYLRTVITEYSTRFKAVLFPITRLIPLKMSVLRWFERFNLGTPENIILLNSQVKSLKKILKASTIWNCLMIDPRPKDLLVECLRNVKHVEWTYGSQHHRSLLYMLQKCKLERVVYPRIYGGANITDVKSLIDGSILQVLDLSNCIYFDESGLIGIIRCCPKLTDIALYKVTGQNIGIPIALAVHCRKLKSYKYFNPMVERVTQILFLHGPKLFETIDLKFTYDSIMCLRCLFWFCSSKLKILSLNGYENIRYVLIEAVSHSLVSNLTQFSFYGNIEDSSTLSNFVMMSPALECIEMIRSFHSFYPLDCFPHLRLLRFITLHNASNEELSTLLKNNKLLTSVNIAFITDINDDIAYSLGTLSFLSSLSVHWCKLTNKFCFVLSELCPRLTSLNFSFNHFTNEGITALLKNLRIKKLMLSHCKLDSGLVEPLLLYCQDCRLLNLMHIELSLVDVKRIIETLKKVQIFECECDDKLKVQADLMLAETLKLYPDLCCTVHSFIDSTWES